MNLTGLSLFALSVPSLPALASAAQPNAASSGLASSFARYTSFLTLIAGLNGCGSAQDNRGEVESVPDVDTTESGYRSVDFQGWVIDKKFGKDFPICVPNATITVDLEDGRSFMLKRNEQCDFLLEDVPAGEVRFSISAPEFRPIEETLVLGGLAEVERIFELEHILQAGDVEVRIVDKDSGAGIEQAQITIMSGKELSMAMSLKADATGLFRVEGVPKGEFVFWITPPDASYLPTVRHFEMKVGDDQRLKVRLMKRPQVSNIALKGVTITTKQAILFKDRSYELNMDEEQFQLLMDELADYLMNTHQGQKIHLLEIEGHTADEFPNATRVSHQRADLVLRELLMRGVHPKRLESGSYGNAHPLVPNTSEANRAQNNRVSLGIRTYHPDKDEVLDLENGWVLINKE